MGPELEVELRHRLSRLDLDVALSVGRETLALVGPSGSGKSTILRAVAGLLRPQRGRVVHGGRALLDTERGIDLPPEERRVGVVYQEGALFPFLSVLANVAYGVRADPRGADRREGRGGQRGGRADRREGGRGGRADRRSRERRARSVLERFGIAGLAEARPGDLSGGERQRVALARAVASDPQVLLLDEPLSALDAMTRLEVAAELGVRLRELRLPSILVSHDFADVLGLADTVAVLEGGRVVQAGSVAELAEAPASAFVASLAGVNYLAGRAVRRGDLTEVRGDGWAAPLRSVDAGEGPVGVVVYPWEVSLSRSPTPADGSALNAVSGIVRRVSVVGNRARISLDSTPPLVAEVTHESVRHLDLAPGTPVVASWKATATRLVPGPG
jgi:molybdate transport system ATP-binding protein